MSAPSSSSYFSHHQQRRRRHLDRSPRSSKASTTTTNAENSSDNSKNDDDNEHAQSSFVKKQQRRNYNINNNPLFASLGGGTSKHTTTTTTKKKSNEEEEHNSNKKEKKEKIVVPLSIWESRKGSNFKRQYAIDGDRLRLLTPEEAHDILGKNNSLKTTPMTRRSLFGGNEEGTTTRFQFDPLHLGRKKRAFLRQLDAIRDSLVPQKSSVSSDYWDYAKYRFTQRMASSTMSVLATQQMLAAIGLGASRSIPAAAALNWVLKDGLGRLGKLSVATNFGRSFDSDVKRLRFSSSLVYTSAVFIETITPYFPKHFLAIATIANVGKSIGITSSNVVRPPIQKTFALEENLGEIAAKTSAQQVLADNIGLAIGVSVMRFQTKFVSLSLQRAVPLALFPLLACVDLFSIHKQLKSVQLRTVNKERAEIIAESFVRSNKKSIATRFEVAEKERLLFPARLDASALPLRVTSLGTACSTLDKLASAFKDDVHRKYVLTYEPYVQKKKNFLPKLFFMRDKKPLKYKGRAMLALSNKATSKDVLQGILQVAHIRNLPFRKDLNGKEAYNWAVYESERRAKADVNTFYDQIVASGWQANLILLSSNERMPYFFEDEKELKQIIKLISSSNNNK